ncbi:type II toxin-antitoxin system RelE/ParE family toxin [Streptomyces sp. NPDC059680]|uniref:type II toxin-antitoxin system RelE family toxin n=1 Tax=Streptomyces TaxID=1883 RepID=UPI001E382105|nr:type II toxin-antitoxin system RelE/ParE family toxin [Streptomyces barringtoniae]MCC5480049.1 type II toxin-antitoxin system RelE/ParE family toxin [Streptomyces barringtoniae]
MTYEIIFEPHALDVAARFLNEGPAGLAEVLDAIDELAHDPRPAGSRAYGPNLRRLRVDAYRVPYIIDTEVVRILVTHPGRTD